MLRLLKAALLAFLVAALGVAGLLRWQLERTARAAVSSALSPVRGLSWAGVRVRAFPPAAVLEGLVLRGAEERQVLAAKTCVFPLAPGAWFGRGRSLGPPALEGFDAVLDCPANGACSFARFLGGEAGPTEWTAHDGRVEIRFGYEPTAAGVILTGAFASRHGDGLHLEGVITRGGGEGGRLAFDGTASGGGLSGSLGAGPLDATQWQQALLPPQAGRVLGGWFSLEGALEVDRAGALSFRGSARTRDLVVEGAGGKPGPLEAALSRGRGSIAIPLSVVGRLDRGEDWTVRFRDALAHGAGGIRAVP